MEKECTVADRKLRDVVMQGVASLGISKAGLQDEIDWELNCIREMEQSFLYLLLYEAMKAVYVKKKEYWLTGSLSSAVVPFALGFSRINPLEMDKPKLYPEFAYGIPGHRKQNGLEVRMTRDLWKRVEVFFQKYDPECAEYGEPIYLKQIGDGVHGVWEKWNIPEGQEPEYGLIAHKPHITFIEIADKPQWEALIDPDIARMYGAKSFEDYVKCFALIHGSGAWSDNAKELVLSGHADKERLITDRESVYELLTGAGADKADAYVIAQTPYLFPRAHAVSILQFYFEMPQGDGVSGSF